MAEYAWSQLSRMQGLRQVLIDHLDDFLAPLRVASGRSLPMPESDSIIISDIRVPITQGWPAVYISCITSQWTGARSQAVKAPAYARAVEVAETMAIDIALDTTSTGFEDGTSPKNVADSYQTATLYVKAITSCLMAWTIHDLTQDATGVIRLTPVSPTPESSPLNVISSGQSSWLVRYARATVRLDSTEWAEFDRNPT